MKYLIASKASSIVIDDAGYLITNHFMRGHASTGKGNAVFSLYNDIGDYFWNLIQFIVTKVPEDKIVYLMMHEEKDDSGESSCLSVALASHPMDRLLQTLYGFGF